MYHHKNQMRHGVMLMDVIGAIFVVGLAVVMLSVVTGCFVGSSLEGRRMQNGTQVRSIQQGLVLYSMGGQVYYPGIRQPDARVGFIQSQTEKYNSYGAAALSSIDPTALIYATLLTGNYLTPEYAISPFEKNKSLATPGPVPISNTNYSFALLSIADPTIDKGRRKEWTSTENGLAPIAGDRSKAIDPTMTTTSIHVNATTSASADWQGNIVWNDNHVTWEKSGLFAGDAIKMYDKTGKATDIDDLFDGAAVGSDLPADTNALFAY